MGKAKSSGGHKTSSGITKKIHLRQHLRRIIKKCLKRPECFMDISAFESWKRLGYGDLGDLGKFSKKVEINNDGSVNILEYYSDDEVKMVLSRIHVKGPVHTQKLKKKEPQNRPPKKQQQHSKNGNKQPVDVNEEDKPSKPVAKKKNFSKKPPKPAAEKKEN